MRPLSTFPSVRANVFVFVGSWIFPPQATFLQITILLFLHDKFLSQYLGLNIPPKVAGTSPQCLLSFFRFSQQKQKQTGRIPFYLFVIFRVNNPPSLVA
ncbi:MAG: hypothetical protein U0469_02010 [Candidatus Paceibacterota bacterium]